MEVKVVIGSNYGDEGKGLVTHFFSQDAAGKVLNILHNGGCQRGHTVRTDGKRHVFHCFGSGTFDGADTYYAPLFLVDPIAYTVEIDQLGFCPDVYCAPNCRVVTPYDIEWNKALERSRGGGKHGSCGMGIFATIQRHTHIMLCAGDLWDDFKVYDYLKKIKHYYTKLLKENEAVAEFYHMPELDPFFRSVHLFQERVKLASDAKTLYEHYSRIIYEGGQGLRLDQENHGDFPHLTPSWTGSYWVWRDVNANVEVPDIEVCYVTRPYLTRHGAGPLDDECAAADLSTLIEDKTNQPNKWQGSLRFAPMNLHNISVWNSFINDDYQAWVEFDSYCRKTCAMTQAHLSNDQFMGLNRERFDFPFGSHFYHTYYFANEKF